MNSPLTFGEWLRQSREELGLTRKEFARRVGCSVSTLRKIEDGERHPSVQISELIANCLDISQRDHSTFVKVARGELSVDRLSPVSKLAANASISSASIASAPRSNLPALPTPLIGRQREMEELIRLLRDLQCRLLTLVGPGGIGKTRLAIETASRIREAFADGVYLVSLASVNTTQLIVPMIADMIGFTFHSTGSADPKIQLFNYLKQKQILLLMDNLEHLLTEPGIEMLAELLTNAPQVKLLTTSRESLGLQGEWIFEVHGLPVPENPQTEDSTQDTSVELFLQRARRAHVEFDATSEDLSAILRICNLVDGMPLALELAAAWVRTLTCDEIAKEIERGLDFLRVSTRDLPPRHRSMRAVFDHSWKLLAEEEQQVLAQLSVFRGGFTRQAAEQVARASLSMLSALMTKSLVRRSGDQRYDLHELVRQYAADQLADQPKAWKEAQERHGNYYLTYFGQADGRLRSSAQRETLAELTAEMDNFRAAWDWAITHHDIARLRQASPTIWYLFELRSWFVEGEAAFLDAAEAIQSRAAEIDSVNVSQTVANALLAHSAYFSFRLGKGVAAYTALLPVANYLHSSSDQSAAVCALWYLGLASWILGKYTDANRSLRASLEKARALGEQWYESMAGQCIGIVAHDTSDYDMSRHYLLEALPGARGTGDPTLIAHTLIFLGEALYATGETAEAEKYLRESLAIAREIGWHHGIGRALDGLGQITQATNPTEARQLFTASSNVFRKSGDLRMLSLVCNHQGYNSLALGDVSDAQVSFIASLRLAHEGGYGPYALDSLVGMARLEAKRGEMEDALEIALMISNHPASSHDTRNRAERLERELEAQLTQQQIEAAQARAQAKSFETVVHEVLEQVELE